MNGKHIGIVYKKELKDLFRDKKTVLGTLVVPLLLFPLLMLIMGGGIGAMVGDAMQDPAAIQLRVALPPEATKDARSFAQNELFAGTAVLVLNSENLQKDLEDGTLDAILVPDADFREKLAAGKPVSVGIVYNEMDTNAEIRVEALRTLIGRFNETVLLARLEALGVSPEILSPVTPQNVSFSEYFHVENRTGSRNPFLQMMLPYLAAILAATAGLSAAVDMIAGEKERATLEPLLSTAANRGSVLLGKFLVVVTFTMMGVLAQGVGMFVGFRFFGKSLMGTAMSGGLSLSPGILLLVLLGFLLLGMTFSCITLSISAVSKTYKEAQTYSGYLVFFPMLIGFFSMFMNANSVSLWMMFVPVLNIVTAMKLVLGGGAEITWLLCAVGSALGYMVLALSLVRSLFAKEKYLFRA